MAREDEVVAVAREIARRLHARAEMIGRLAPEEQSRVLKLLGDALEVVARRMS